MKSFADADKHFGLAVRARRTQLGVTLDQLAETSGVSAAALSRVERGLLSPSLRNALNIAQGLDCDLTELVTRVPAKVIRAGENLRFFDEATGIERLALARPSPELELLKYTIPADMKSSVFTAHPPGTREIFHIIDGSLDIHTDHEEISLRTGDTAVVQVDGEHWFENKSKEETKIIIAVFRS